jgi:hypothetical protein
MCVVYGVAAYMFFTYNQKIRKKHFCLHAVFHIVQKFARSILACKLHAESSVFLERTKLQKKLKKKVNFPPLRLEMANWVIVDTLPQSEINTL